MSKWAKHRSFRTRFEIEMSKKARACVARCKFGSQNVQSTAASEHFEKLRCWKRCRPLWREAHVNVKSVKKWRVQSTIFDVQMSFFAASAKDSVPCQKWANGWRLCSSSSFNHHTTLHYTTLHYTTSHYSTLHDTIQYTHYKTHDTTTTKLPNTN